MSLIWRHRGRSIGLALARRSTSRIPQFTDIPEAESFALEDFYTATAGDSWTDNTGWGGSVANNAFGVTVSGGHVTEIDLHSNNLVGDGLPYLAALTSLTVLNLSNTGVSGDIADIATLTSLTVLNLSNIGVSGDIADIAALTSLTVLYLYNTGVSAGTIGTLIAMRNLQVQNCGWNQAAVDALLADMYAHRADFTYVLPVLNIGGTNSAPSGVYQDATPPTTGKEYIYKLVNDPDSEGFRTWTITYTS